VRAGFLTNITNPKSIAYYMSVFAATGAFTLPPPLRLLAILMLPTIGVLWYGAIALVLSTPALRRRTRAIERWLDRISGAAMVLFGCKLVIGR
jgi:threonine efflux protein